MDRGVNVTVKDEPARVLSSDGSGDQISISTQTSSNKSPAVENDEKINESAVVGELSQAELKKARHRKAQKKYKRKVAQNYKDLKAFKSKADLDESTKCQKGDDLAKELQAIVAVQNEELSCLRTRLEEHSEELSSVYQELDDLKYGPQKPCSKCGTVDNKCYEACNVQQQYVLHENEMADTNYYFSYTNGNMTALNNQSQFESGLSNELAHLNQHQNSNLNNYATNYDSVGNTQPPGSNFQHSFKE